MAIIVGEEQGRAQTTCWHQQHVPVFNAEACRSLPPSAVREQYPRYDGVCSSCKAQIRLYASLAHYFAGGWHAETLPKSS